MSFYCGHCKRPHVTTAKQVIDDKGEAAVIIAPARPVKVVVERYPTDGMPERLRGQINREENWCEAGVDIGVSILRAAFPIIKVAEAMETFTQGTHR